MPCATHRLRCRSWIKYLSFLYYGFGALMTNEVQSWTVWVHDVVRISVCVPIIEALSSSMLVLHAGSNARSNRGSCCP